MHGVPGGSRGAGRVRAAPSGRTKATARAEPGPSSRKNAAAYGVVSGTEMIKLVTPDVVDVSFKGTTVALGSRTRSMHGTESGGAAHGF
jgi:hypothetical protein